MELKRLHAFSAACAFAPLLALPTAAAAATVSNPSTSPQCMSNTAFFNPQLPPSIVLPPGFTASVFVQGLNMPTGIAFLGNSSSFQVFVLESGHGLPSACNDETLWPGGEFATNNPFTPDILVFNQKREIDPRPPGQTDLQRGRVPAFRAGDRHRLY
jgi:glucose/arabinose dehydrogenase